MTSKGIFPSPIYPAYLSISKNPKYLGVGWGQGAIFFGNHLPINDLPYSNGFMKFGYPEPSKVMFDFGQEAFDSLLVFLMNTIFFGEMR